MFVLLKHFVDNVKVSMIEKPKVRLPRLGLIKQNDFYAAVS